jgi:hypothetical protein
MPYDIFGNWTDDPAPPAGGPPEPGTPAQTYNIWGEVVAPGVGAGTPAPENYGSGAASNPQHPSMYPGAPPPVPQPGEPGGPGPWTGGMGGHDNGRGGQADADMTDYGLGAGMGKPQGGPPAPGTSSGPANDPLVPVTGNDGRTQMIPQSQKDAWERQQALYAQNQREQQNLINQQNQQKIDIDRMRLAGEDAYRQSMLQFNDRQLAQTAAIEAQRMELQQQQMSMQAAATAQQSSIEREKMDAQRMAMRPRRVATVRYR